MTKEVLSVRLEPKVRKVLERLARERGRTLSEESALALEEHSRAAEAIALATTESRSVHSLADVRAFVWHTLDFRLVRETPPELNPALAVVFSDWEEYRGTVPDRAENLRREYERSGRVGSALTRLYVIGDWLSDRIEDLFTHPPSLEVLRALEAGGLIPTPDSDRIKWMFAGKYPDRGPFAQLVRLLDADIGRRVEAIEWLEHLHIRELADRAAAAVISGYGTRSEAENAGEDA